MPFNTGNPVPSNAGEDLDDNCRFFDEFAAGTSASAVDRLGTSRKTIAGMEAEFNVDQADRVSEFDADQAYRADQYADDKQYRDSTFASDQSYRANAFQAAQDDREGVFNAYLVSAGYQFAGDYAAGIEITQYNQVVRDSSGEFWRVSGSTELPYTTTGAGLPEGGAFVYAGDAVLRQELVNPGIGAAMVARGVVAVDSIAGLLNLSAGQRREDLRYFVASYHLAGDDRLSLAGSQGGGMYVWSPTAQKSAHDGGRYIDPDKDMNIDW